MAYNKNCYADPYDNQSSVSSSCLGIIYDVTGNGKPNTNGKDIMANANVDKVKDVSGCVYVMKDGTCFSKILGPQNGGYTYLTNAECTQAKTDGKIDVDYCYSGSNDKDYYAGAVLACGGKKNNLPDATMIAELATELYNYQEGANDHICASCRLGGYTVVPGLSLSTTKAELFLAQTPLSDGFNVWSRTEGSSSYAYHRGFGLDITGYGDNLGRYESRLLAVCLGD